MHKDRSGNAHKSSAFHRDAIQNVWKSFAFYEYSSNNAIQNVSKLLDPLLRQDPKHVPHSFAFYGDAMLNMCETHISLDLHRIHKVGYEETCIDSMSLHRYHDVGVCKMYW